MPNLFLKSSLVSAGAVTILKALWLAYADGIVWDNIVSGNVNWEDSTY